MENIPTAPQKPSIMTPPPTPTQPTPPPSSKKWLWIVIIVAIIAAAGAGGFWWWQNKDKGIKKESQSTTETSMPTDESSKDTEATEGWQTFTNTAYKYSIEFPKDWEVTGVTNADTGKGLPPAESTSVRIKKLDGGKVYGLHIGISLAENYRYAKNRAKIYIESNDLEIEEEKEITLDGVNAYYFAYKNQGDQPEDPPTYGKEIYAINGDYLYNIHIGEDIKKSNPVDETDLWDSLPFTEWENQETFDKIVKSFKFLEPETSFDKPTMNNSCLQHPVEMGDTWTYQTTSSGLGLETKTTDVAKVTDVYDNEFTIQNDTTEGDSTGSHFEETYGFDDSGNMYLNYRSITVESSSSGYIGGGSTYYYGYKLLSCQENEWKISAKASPSKITADSLVHLEGEIEAISGTAKVLDRQAKVNVPAGDFEAILVEYNLEANADTSMGNINVPINQKIWFAPGIGIVKQENVSIATEIKELIEYNFAHID